MAHLPPVNFGMQRPSRARLQAGDIFTMKVPDGRFLFGRVVRTDADCFGPRCILIYVFRYLSEKPVPPARLLVSDLLIPPETINRLGWSRGYLMTVDHRPFEDGERMAVHYFKQRRNGEVRYLDEDRQPLGEPPPGTMVGWFGLGNYRILDDAVSGALGIPLAPDPSEPGQGATG
jgi:hypothetical protein